MKDACESVENEMKMSERRCMKNVCTTRKVAERVGHSSTPRYHAQPIP